jgi:ATP-dependent Clp protease protease subunit
MPKEEKGYELAVADESAMRSPVDTPEHNPTLKEKGIYFLSGGFNPVTAKEIITWILEANLAKKRNYDHLTLMINSPGGQISSAMAIIDVMRGSKIPVHTIGLGMIGSCGLLTFIAGEAGQRILTPNTSILSHQWSWMNAGKEHELLATVREYHLTTIRMVEHYKKCTGLDEDTIREKLLPAQDIWLSAEEAKELNICDDIRDMQ